VDVDRGRAPSGGTNLVGYRLQLGAHGWQVRHRHVEPVACQADRDPAPDAAGASSDQGYAAVAVSVGAAHAATPFSGLTAPPRPRARAGLGCYRSRPYGGSADRGRLATELVVQLPGIDLQLREQLGVALGVDLLAELPVPSLDARRVAARPKLLDDHLFGEEHLRFLPSDVRTAINRCARRRESPPGFD